MTITFLQEEYFPQGAPESQLHSLVDAANGDDARYH